MPPVLEETATATQAAGAAAQEHATNIDLTSNAQRRSAQAMSNVLKSLGDEAAARDMSVREAQAYLQLHKDAIPGSLGLSGAALVGYVAALQGETQAHFDSVSAAAEWITVHHEEVSIANMSDAAILALAEKLKEEDKAAGKATETTAKFVEELTKLKTGLQEGAAELAFYAEAGNMANRMNLEFQTGIQEAQLALIDQNAELTKNTGELLTNIELLKEGSLQELAYGQGVIEAGNAIKEKVLALEKAKGAYEVTNKLIQEAGLLALEQAVGFQEAKKAVQDETIALNNQLGALKSWQDEATRTQARQNALLKGWLDEKEALRDNVLAYDEAAGRLAALVQEMDNAGQSAFRYSAGIMQGAADTLEWANSLDTARG